MKIKKLTIKIEKVDLAVSEESPLYGRKVASSRDVGSVLQALIGSEAVEVFVAVLLDAKHSILGYSEIGRGSVTGCQVSPGDVFRAAIMQGAASIIVSHNHPSGQCGPSDADMVITKEIVKAGKILGIPVLDHVIVSTDGYLSFMDKGLLG